jgi:hypothetical protein
MWRTGLLLAAFALFVGVLKVVFGVDTRAIAPAFLIVMFAFLVSIVVWAFTTRFKPTQPAIADVSHGMTRPLTARGVLIEQPVLGVLAVVMLLVSVGVATYMLTAAAFRSYGSRSALRSELALAVRAVNEELSPEEEQRLNRENPFLALQLRDAESRAALHFLAKLPEASRKELLSKGYVKWPTASLPGRGQVLAPILNPYLTKSDAQRDFQLGWPRQTVHAFGMSTTGFAVVELPPSKQRIISWFMIWPDGAPSSREVVTGKGLFEKVDDIAKHSSAIHKRLAEVRRLPNSTRIVAWDVPRFAESLTASQLLEHLVDLTKWGRLESSSGAARLDRDVDSVVMIVPPKSPGVKDRASGDRHEAAMLTEQVEGDFILEAVLLPFEPPAGNYRGAGLVVKADDDNFLEFKRGDDSGNQDGAPHVSSSYFVDGKYRGSRPEMLLDDPTGATHFQIERRGNRLDLRFRSDHELWTHWQTISEMKLPRRVSVGLQASNATNSELKFKFAQLIVAPNSSPRTTASSSSSAAVPVPPRAGLTDAWTPLFNGQDLTGWKAIPPQHWRVENGVIHGSGSDAFLLSEVGDLEDFHLRVEFRINAEGDAGVHFRMPPPTRRSGQHWGYNFVGLEAEIGIRKPPGYRTGALTLKDPQPRVLASAPEPSHAADEWATLEIIAQQKRIQTLVNGQVVNDFIDSERKFRRGHIALASWEDSRIKTRVEFRKVDVKVLAPDAGAAAPEPAVVQPLRELVAAKQRSLKIAQGRFEAKVGTRMEVLAAEIEHIEARIRLADAERQRTTVAALLKELVAHREEERRLLAQMVQARVATPDELNQADARLAEAKARLAEGSGAAQPD